MYASPYDPATCETAPGIPINLEITADDKVYRRSSLKVVYETDCLETWKKRFLLIGRKSDK